MSRTCVILGAGGHARVLLDCLEAMGVNVCGLLDSEAALHGRRIQDVPVLGGDEWLAGARERGVDCFAVGVGGSGDNRPRRRLYDWALGFRLEPLTVTHPSALCSRWARIGPGCQLFPGSIINAGSELGENVIVNTGAVIEHDCRVGSHAHVATGARLSGGVIVGELAHIGAGATVRQMIKIGEGAVVGAGAVVVKDVAPGTVVVGVPARPLEIARR